MLVSQSTIDELRELPRRRMREEINVLEQEVIHLGQLKNNCYKQLDSLEPEFDRMVVKAYLCNEAQKLDRQISEKQDEIGSLKRRLENDCD